MQALGWSIGAVCVSTIDDAGTKLCKGDRGKVVGPGTSAGGDAGQRVLADYGAKGQVNVLAKEQIITVAEYELQQAAKASAAAETAGGGCAAAVAPAAVAAAATAVATTAAAAAAAAKAAAAKAAAAKAAAAKAAAAKAAAAKAAGTPVVPQGARRVLLRLVDPMSGALQWLECDESELVSPCAVLGLELPALEHKTQASLLRYGAARQQQLTVTLLLPL